MNDLSGMLMEQMRRLQGMDGKDGETLKTELQRSREMSNLGKQVVEVERVKVEQARVLVDAGLPAQVGNVVFHLEDKDAHPKVLKA